MNTHKHITHNGSQQAFNDHGQHMTAYYAQNDRSNRPPISIGRRLTSATEV